jgi:hypothetical protein
MLHPKKMQIQSSTAVTWVSNANKSNLEDIYNRTQSGGSQHTQTKQWSPK